MYRRLIVLLALCAWIPLAAQTTNTSQPSSVVPQDSNKPKNEITVRGCVSKQNTDYILMQPDRGNSYQLDRPRKLRLAKYLGQEVEITGTEYPSLATSSDYLARSGVASPVTIRITTIKTIAKRCSD